MGETEQQWQDYLTRFAGGDADAWPPFYQLAMRELITFLIRRGHTSEDAEDIAQEALVKVFRAAKTFDSKRSARGWVFQIARNTSNDVFRARRRQPTTTSHDFRNTVDPSTDGVGSDTPSIDEILKGLNEIERDILILKYVNGLSYAEIEEALPLSSTAASTQVYRAMKKVRELKSIEV